jgi:monofunctional biosynthetic peptidoglycan transglycosylase
VKNYLYPLLVLFLSACGSGKGCAPRFSDLKTQYPHVIYHGSHEPSEVVIKRYPPAHWVSLGQVSKKAQGAILVSEDWAFYQHPGYDQKQIQEAIRESVEAGHLTRGASTITQQVVRNIYLSKEKSLSRKARELWMASKIEKVLGKNKILELYLNIAEMGDGIFGVGQASEFYFHKPASQLNAKEGAFLAMLLPSPKKYAISFRKKQLTPFARRIIRSVLNKMVMAHYLSSDERDQEWNSALSFESSVDHTIPNEDLSDPTQDEEEGKDESQDLQSS